MPGLHHAIDAAPVFAQARAAWQRARVPVSIKGGILDAEWTRFEHEWRQIGAVSVSEPGFQPSLEQQRVNRAAIASAERASQLFAAFATFDQDAMFRATPFFQGTPFCQCPEAAIELRKRPEIAAWLDARLARAAAADAANLKAQELRAAEAAAAAERTPERVLAGLDARRIVLSLDAKGGILAPWDVALSDEDRGEISQHKAAIVALLRVRAEERRPRLVA